MWTLTKLEELAEKMGITITAHTNGEKGRWYRNTSTISIRKGMHPTQTLCTLAHELGHAHHQHTPSTNAWTHERQEREADRWAAALLIGEDAFINAERDCGGHEGAMAEELGVTIHLIRAWKAAFPELRAREYCRN